MAGSLRVTPLVDTIDDMLQPGSDLGAVAPMVDDPERVLEKQDRTFNGPIRLRIARILSGEHILPPSRRPRPTAPPVTFFEGVNSMKVAQG